MWTQDEETGLRRRSKKKDLINKNQNPSSDPWGLRKKAVENAKANNVSERGLARARWNEFTTSNPSLKTLFEAGKHYFNSIPLLGGESELETSYDMLGNPRNYGSGAIEYIAGAPIISTYSLKAKKLYDTLTKAEKSNFDVFLRNGNSSLDKITPSEFAELKRLIRSRTDPKPTPIEPVSIDRYESKGWWDYTKEH